MVESNKERPILMLHDEKLKDQQWTLTRDNLIIGRGEECDIVLPERQISRQHVRIFKEDDAYYIEDLESRNGTWVNGQQLKGTRRLYDGDKIQLALAVLIEFIGSGATAPLEFQVPINLTGGRLRLDHDARRVFINDTEIDPPLSPPQYRLLEMLYNNAGRICTRDTVVETVWPDAVGEGVSEQAIDALVRRLRDRLAEVDPDWQYIITVRGHGFRLNNPGE
ncbi:MAG TPA: FHA domain-containing protein [Phototrophicaceae bacterium]|nr:FHA domain-containing protein [Phototrophicaceae bacterium]